MITLLHVILFFSGLYILRSIVVVLIALWRCLVKGVVR
jgi:hypothetical protein